MFNAMLFVGTVAAAIATAIATPIANGTEPAITVRAADVDHTGQATWFDVGLGACGNTNVNSDPVVAVSTERYGSGGNCFQWMKITANGKTFYGQTLDECPGCGEFDLDLSPSLFQKFAPLSQGVIKNVVWSFEPFGFQPPPFKLMKNERRRV